MSSAPPVIVLVTPVWNDSERLSRFGAELAEKLAHHPRPIQWVIADDGSTEEDHQRLQQLTQLFREKHHTVHLHRASSHRGKGAVVREAWSLHANAAWLAFVDADGSVSATEMLGLIETAITRNAAILGVRLRTDNTTVVESFWRGLAHRGYLFTTKLVLGLRCCDPQCGSKVIGGQDFRKIAPHLREDGLAFDSELLATLQHHDVDWHEIPVNWTQKDHGTVRVSRDAWGMLRAIFRIRKQLRSKATHSKPTT